MKIKVNGVTINDYLVNDITYNYDAICSTFSLTLPYFELWSVSKNIFKPLKYQQIEITTDEGIPLLKGTILNDTKEATANGVELALSGYSKTGVLEDCPNVPITSTNNKKLTFKELTEKLIEPFGIELEINRNVVDKCNEIYEFQNTKNNESIASFLSKLATLKNIVISSTTDGKLLYTQLNTNIKPIYHFTNTDNTILSIKLACNGQSMHSEIKMNGEISIVEDEKSDSEKSGVSSIIKNPLITVHRPTEISQGSENNSVEDATKAALANELQNINLIIVIRDFKIIEKELLLPGKIISVKNEKIGLYNTTNFIIKNVSLKQDSKGKTSTLNCVLVEAITGEQPNIIF